MTNRLDMGRDHDCFLVETNVPCEHNNSARRASPPLNDTLYWSEPQLKILWYCEMCNRLVLDKSRALTTSCNSAWLHECYKCGLWCCQKCYYKRT